MSTKTTYPGDALVRLGAVVFLVGAVATVVTVAPLLLGTSRLPTAAYFVCMAMPLGFLVALLGLVRSARHQGRLQRAARS